MLANIIDSRKRPHRWKRVHAIVEATWHDNGVDDADQAEEVRDERYVMCEDRTDICVAEAVAWAQSQPCPVTLYLYDPGAGTSAA